MRTLPDILYIAILLVASSTALLLHHAGLSEQVALGIITAIVIAWLLLAESIWCAEPAWRHTRDASWRGDLWLAILNLGVPGLYLFALSWAGLELATPHHTLPLPAEALLALLIADALAYTGHRIMHRVTLLWRLHHVHHSPRGLYWLNARRFHPLDTLLLFAACWTPLLLLGISPEAMLMVSTLHTTQALLQHANIAWRRSALSALLCTPDDHRWHHHDAPKAVNFGTLFSIWDRLFGTYYSPDDPSNSPRPGAMIPSPHTR